MNKIGIDLVTVKRIRDILNAEYGERFLRHVCREEERAVLERYSMLVEGCAVLFSAKESVSKVLGTGIAKLGNPYGVPLHDIEIYHEPSGAPVVKLHGKAREIARSKGLGQLCISISTEKEYVVTVAVGEYSMLENTKQT